MSQEERLQDLSNTGRRIKRVDSKAYIDPDSGEIVDFEVIQRPANEIPQRHIRQRSKHGYFLAFDTVVDAAQQIKDHPGYLGYDERAVLRECAALIEYEYQYVCHPKTGERMNIHTFAHFVGKDRKFIIQTLRSLESKGYISLEKSGRAYYILVDKEVAWRGEIKKNDKVRVMKR